MAVPLLQVLLQVCFARDTLAVLARFDDLFGAHPTALGGEIDAFAGALGDITSGVTHQGHAAHHTAGTGMLGNGVSFHLDHLTVDQALLGPLTDAFLQALDQGLVLLHGSGADRNVVVLGEHPGVEVGGHVRAHVHLGEALVVLHLLRGELDALLEGDRHVVIAGVHGLGHAAVGTVGANDQVHLKALGFARGFPFAVVGIGEGVRPLAVGTGVDLGDQAIHQVRTQFGGTVAQEGIHDLPAAHADVLVLVIEIDVHLAVRGGDHLHVADLAVDDRLRQVELSNHAEGDRTTTGFGVIELALKDPGLDARLRQNFRSTRTTRAAAHHRDSQHLETRSARRMLRRS